MIKSRLIISVLLTALVLPTMFSRAADQSSNQENIQEKKSAQVYGSQLMNPQEGKEFRDKMRSAKTAAELPNGHGKYATPDNETGHARFPDRPTSHSTSLPKDSNQVAGYHPISTHEPPPQNGFRRVRLRTNG